MQRKNQQRLKWLCHGDRRLIDGLRVAVSIFESEHLSFGQGTADAFEDAAWLLLWSLDLPRDRLDDFRESIVPASEWRAISHLIRKRVDQRTPVSYLTGEAWLAGLRFRSDQRALIPRSLLVEALSFCIDEGLMSQASHVLDLCTGSGSILIHAGHRFPDAALFGSDLSAQALELARVNLNEHGLSSRATLKQGSGLEPWDDVCFDLILCNPPYVNQGSMRALPAEFLAEPASALDGGLDGMDFCRSFLNEAQAKLSIEGQILLEIGHEAAHFDAAFPALEKTWIPVQAGESMVALITGKALLRLG